MSTGYTQVPVKTRPLGSCSFVYCQMCMLAVGGMVGAAWPVPNDFDTHTCTHTRTHAHTHVQTNTHTPYTHEIKFTHAHACTHIHIHIRTHQLLQACIHPQFRVSVLTCSPSGACWGKRGKRHGPMVDVAAVVGCGGSGHGGTGVYAIVFVSSRMFESLCVCLF